MSSMIHGWFSPSAPLIFTVDGNLASTLDEKRETEVTILHAIAQSPFLDPKIGLEPWQSVSESPSFIYSVSIIIVSVSVSDSTKNWTFKSSRCFLLLIQIKSEIGGRVEVETVIKLDQMSNVIYGWEMHID
ncbi:hypothetical protein L1987_08750 [Smallanthus sonchifolius]|uniref:Uncharacterized protein n=1 Tax=Smallanthus sonchifolius TaxID=185202 RepID=A0ACB9JNB5_9ASTR|nr:hypothetical protein L1987_08750 [Smallanthus sonchifolius]